MNITSALAPLGGVGDQQNRASADAVMAAAEWRTKRRSHRPGGKEESKGDDGRRL